MTADKFKLLIAFHWNDVCANDSYKYNMLRSTQIVTLMWLLYSNCWIEKDLIRSCAQLKSMVNRISSCYMPREHTQFVYTNLFSEDADGDADTVIPRFRERNIRNDFDLGNGLEGTEVRLTLKIPAIVMRNRERF
ncbi:hypothetical protein EDC96DRAFT_566165 [Choanephora cucurbitarum]|nr:hypothetical protein EDC96DRAFT_566165 [Choanephora cucurbitarum]